MYPDPRQKVGTLGRLVMRNQYNSITYKIYLPKSYKGIKTVNLYPSHASNVARLQESFWLKFSVTRLGDLLDFGQLFKAFSNN